MFRFKLQNRKFLDRTVGSKQLRKVRHDFKIKFIKEINIEETNFNPKEKAIQTNNLVEEAKEYHSELGRNATLILFILGTLGFIDASVLGNLIPIVGDVSFLNYFLMIFFPFLYFVFEIPMRQIIVEIVSHKKVSPRNKRVELKVMEAWNKSLKGGVFLAGVYLIGFILRISPTLYEKGIEILMNQASREKSRREIICDSAKSLFRKEVK